VLGVFAGLFKYWKTTKKEQLDREYGTYNALDDKCLDFVKLCLQRPHLDIFDVVDREPKSLTDEQKKEEQSAFTILISIFERAFLMYRRQSSKLRDKQWSGWEEYIKSFATRQNFRDAFSVSGRTFDTEFQEYMDGLLEAAVSTTPIVQVDHN